MKIGRNKPGVMIALACLLLTCAWVVATPCPSNPIRTKEPLYIERVWPPSESEILLGCYVKRYFLPPLGKGIGVEIDTGDTIWELESAQSNDENLMPFPDRVSLVGAHTLLKQKIVNILRPI